MKLFDYVCYIVIVTCSIILFNRHVLTQPQPSSQPPKKIDALKASFDRTASNILAHYKYASPSLVRQVVEYAHTYARPDFPRQADILALVAIESSFRPNAKSNLAHDPAIGLTQIRPEKWKHKYDPRDLKDIRNQIKFCAEILEHNYKRLDRRPDMALHAYNVGMTAVLRGQKNPKYVWKFHKAKEVMTL